MTLFRQQIKQAFKKRRGRLPSTKRLRMLEERHLAAKHRQAVALLELQQERQLHWEFAGVCDGIAIANQTK